MMGMKNWKRSGMAVVMAMALVGVLAGCATGGGAPKNPLVGSWTLTVNSPMGESEQGLVVNSDLTGTLEMAEMGMSVDVTDVTAEGNNVSFKIVFDLGGQELPATFEGVVTGDAIEGEFVTDMGNASVTGVRN